MLRKVTFLAIKKLLVNMKKLFWLLLVVLVSFTACEEDGGINIFSIEDDLELGLQLRDEVLSSSEYQVLERTQYPESYAYLDNMVENILDSGNVKYRDEFAWEVYLLEDETLNAFAAPGGYIFVYSGLIKFLDRPDDLAGVLAHEIAHADQRHSTDQLTKRYGLSTLLGLVLGENSESAVTDILSGLLDLRFSRSDESEADAFSVRYLCETEYASNGAASFFEKLTEDSPVAIPAFLSTHPNPENRVADINQLTNENQCDTQPIGNLSNWTAFQNSLP
jgi:predicted Zn-dependent protease